MSSLEKKLSLFQSKSRSDKDRSNEGSKLHDVVKSMQTENEGHFISIRCTDIVKVWNPRETPCSLSEFSVIDWPELDTPIDSLNQSLFDCLNRANQPWWSNADEQNKKSYLEFITEIHSLAVSMADNQQIQNIVAQRVSAGATKFELIAGERRVLAALYSKGKISELAAKVFNVPLDPLKVAYIRDHENVKKGLNTYECIVSKKSIWDALPTDKRNDYTLPELAKFWHYSSLSTPSILKRLFCLDNCNVVLNEIKSNNLGWREIDALVKESKTGTDQAKKDKGSTRQITPGFVQRAKSFGFSFKKDPKNLKVAESLISLAMESDRLPDDVKHQLRSLDMTNVENMAEGWCILASHFVETA